MDIASVIIFSGYGPHLVVLINAESVSYINVKFTQLFYLDIKLKISPGHLSRDKTFNSFLVSYRTKTNYFINQMNWTSKPWEIGQVVSYLK